MANNNETILKGRYRLTAQQGSGGMAVIYKAYDPKLSRTVAIKILRPSLIQNQEMLSRFQNEARSVANLTHPNIVTVFDVDNDGATQFIVMEFVDGQDLKAIIKREGALTLDRVLRLAIQICNGIGYAHRTGLVHADVKPQNILVTREDVVKVTDFGIAQAFSDSQPAERQQVVWGSPHYFSPEQARGEKPTPPSDVYAIGIVLFEMLTGRLPYTGTDQQQLALSHIRDRIPLVTEFNPAVPEALAQIVQKVMSKEPSARYRTADQLASVLESYQSRGREHTAASVPSYPPPQPPLPPQPSAYTAPPSQSYPPPSQQYPPQQASAAQPPLPFSQTNQPSVPLPFTGASQPANIPSPFEEPPSLPFTQSQQPLPNPTERYNLAPNAPQSAPYARPGQPQQSLNRINEAPAQYQAPAPQWGTVGSNSQPIYNSRPLGQEEDLPPTLDAVTIVLAVIAFFAVLGLVPLWIIVYLARFAG